MPPLLDTVMLACLATCGVLALIDLLWLRLVGDFTIEAGMVLAAWLIFYGLPKLNPTGLIPFGTRSDSFSIVALVFLSVVMGMAAHYFYFLRSRFSWLRLLRPLCVSPIVVLPLVSILENAGERSPIQVLYICLLAFQNGFFWRMVFERAQAKMP